MNRDRTSHLWRNDHRPGIETPDGQPAATHNRTGSNTTRHARDWAAATAIGRPPR